MIADRNNGIQVQSTLGGDKVAMGIDPAAMAHIMNILTDLYSDPELAVIREYSTNGRDATVEAGRNDPIEVTTPTAFSPFLKIRDYGIGLTVDDIHTIYSQYGTSTKRNSNDFNGMLGLGCKSALTYCDQFTVVSVKDGVMVTVVVARDADGAGSMTVLDTSSTDQRDGTEVQIPAKRGNDIRAKAERFFSVWAKGTVLLDGETPKPFEGLRLTDDLYIIEDSQSYIVMGGVTYPAVFDLPHVSTRYGNRAGRGYGNYSDVEVMAHVAIGDVNFAPSREALMDTDKTKATIKRIEGDFGREINNAIQREVDAAPTPQAAVRIIVKWNKYVAGNQAVSNYTYKGTPLPVGFTPPPQVDVLGNPKLDYRGAQLPALIEVAPYRNHGRTRSNTSKFGTLSIHDWPTTVWVAGFDPAKFTAQHKDKLHVWAGQQFGTEAPNVVSQFALVRGPAPVSVFIDPKMVVDWTTIKAIKLAVNTTINGRPARIAGSFDLWTKKRGEARAEFSHGVPGDKINLRNPVFWHQGNRYSCSEYAAVLAGHMPAFTLVCLPGNRIEKFCRELPTAKRVTEGCTAVYDKWFKGLSRAQRAAIAIYDANLTNEFKVLDPTKVTDKLLRQAIRDSKVNVSPLIESRREFRRVVNTAAASKAVFKNPLTKYPLYSSCYTRSNAAHVYSYLNLVDAGQFA
jgi:hypothetical protein